MAEHRIPTTPLQRHTAPLPPARRTVLGVGVAAAAGLVLDVPAALASLAVVPARPPSPESDRHVLFQSFSGHELGSGTHNGTRAHHDGLRIAHAAGARDYADPFGDGTAVAYDEASWTSPVIATPFPFNELIASWNAETPDQTWIEVEARGTDEGGTRSGWYVLGRWCAKDPADGGAIHRTSLDGQRTDLANVWTDTLHVYDPHRLHDWQLRVALLRPQGTTQTPVLRMAGAVASGLPSTDTFPVSPPGRGVGRTIDVPTLSQEVHIGHYTSWNGGGEAWCSATSTAMVLRHWGVGPTPADLAWVEPPVDAEVDFSARNVFDYTYDGAGNWPFNTAYAARYGLEGFITRLRSLTEAEELIRAGIPVIISVSFEKEDLDGAGYGTNGHLMVVVGFTESGDVVVNDPASHLIPDNGEVRTVYRRDQLENAWIPHSGGTAYVIHPRTTQLPRPLDRSEPNW
jgi:Peptidase_C39 like family